MADRQRDCVTVFVPEARGTGRELKPSPCTARNQRTGVRFELAEPSRDLCEWFTSLRRTNSIRSAQNEVPYAAGKGNGN